MTERMRDGVIKRGTTWSYVVREKDPTTGKTKPRWIGGFKTQKAAKEARDAARNAVHVGTYVAPQDLTVATYLDKWLEAHSVELKPSTASSYKAKINLYLKSAIGHEKVQELTPSRLSVVWKKIKENGGKGGKPVSVRTVEFSRAVMRRAMNDAVLDRVIMVNPVTGSKMPKRDGKPQHVTWTGAQLAEFLEAVGGSRWFPLWQLAAATGMRRGELCALRWQHVDLDAGVVSVEQSVTQIGQQRVTTTPKNHERRNIKIDPRTVAALRAWRKQQAAERLQWGPAYVDTEGLVFTWENGTPVLPDYVTKAFGKAQVGSGSPRLVLHGLRHSHATMLLRDGVPVHIVAKRLGHKDPSVTLNVYADVIPDDDESAVDVFSKAVWGA
jgi:integrase